MIQNNALSPKNSDYLEILPGAAQRESGNRDAESGALAARSPAEIPASATRVAVESKKIDKSPENPLFIYFYPIFPKKKFRKLFSKKKCKKKLSPNELDTYRIQSESLYE